MEGGGHRLNIDWLIIYNFEIVSNKWWFDLKCSRNMSKTLYALHKANIINFFIRMIFHINSYVYIPYKIGTYVERRK